MSKYGLNFTKPLLKDLKKIKKQNILHKQFINKTKEVVEDPHRFKPLRNIFKKYRRVRIASFVLVFEIKETEKKVMFHRFQHHDDVYKEPIREQKIETPSRIK